MMATGLHSQKDGRLTKDLAKGCAITGTGKTCKRMEGTGKRITYMCKGWHLKRITGICKGWKASAKGSHVHVSAKMMADVQRIEVTCKRWQSTANGCTSKRMQTVSGTGKSDLGKIPPKMLTENPSK